MLLHKVFCTTFFIEYLPVANSKFQFSGIFWSVTFVKRIRHLTKNQVFHQGFLQLLWPNLEFPTDLVIFTEEIFNGKFNFLWSDRYIQDHRKQLQWKALQQSTAAESYLDIIHKRWLWHKIFNDLFKKFNTAFVLKNPWSCYTFCIIPEK